MEQRTVSISCGSREELVENLERMTKDIESGSGSTTWEIEGNGDGTPELQIQINDESETPEAEGWDKPVVDYS